MFPSDWVIVVFKLLSGGTLSATVSTLLVRESFKSSVSVFTSRLTFSCTVFTCLVTSVSMLETLSWIGFIWEVRASSRNAWLTFTLKVNDSLTLTPSSNMLTSSSSESVRTHVLYRFMSSVMVVKHDRLSSTCSWSKRCLLVFGSFVLEAITRVSFVYERVKREHIISEASYNDHKHVSRKEDNSLIRLKAYANQHTL